MADPDRIDTKGRTLRQHAARGTVINAAFSVGFSTIGLLRGFVLAIFLTREDYGIFGIVGVTLGMIAWLRQIGIGDKFVQQDETDQTLAFQKAFTMELAVSGVATLVGLALLPVVIVAYGRDELLVPILISLTILPALALQSPLWVFYRRMDFFKQRMLQALDPVLGFAVAITLAATGAGYWSLIIGVVAGAWATALAAIIACPVPLRLRWDRSTLRRYAGFSWPLAVASGAGLLIAQGSLLAGEDALGLAGAGAITLAAMISQFTDRIDQLVTGTLYPAICAVRDRAELLYESFVKSNRLALMWAMPFGVALSLFAADIVTFGIGEEWRPVVLLLQVYGVVAAIMHAGFNWEAYFRATDDTRPIAVASIAAAVTFMATAVPLLYAYGLRGFAYGIAAQGVVHLACRAYYLSRLFHGFRFIPHAARAMLPTVPAAGTVFLARAVEGGERTLPMVAGELFVYLVVAVLATLRLEGGLVKEALGYLRPRAAAT